MTFTTHCCVVMATGQSLSCRTNNEFQSLPTYERKVPTAIPIREFETLRNSLTFLRISTGSPCSHSSHSTAGIHVASDFCGAPTSLLLVVVGARRQAERLQLQAREGWWDVTGKMSLQGAGAGQSGTQVASGMRWDNPGMRGSGGGDARSGLLRYVSYMYSSSSARVESIPYCSLCHPG